MVFPLLSPLLPALLGLYPAELPSPVTSLLLHGRFVATKPEFQIIALSNVADACAGLATSSPREARACLERTYELALATRAQGLELLHPDSNHGLWLSHLALVLGRRIARGSVSTRACMSGSLWSLCDGAFRSRSHMCRPIRACVRAGRRIRVRRWRRCAATMSRMGHAVHSARAALFHRRGTLSEQRRTAAIGSGAGDRLWALSRGCALSFRALPGGSRSAARSCAVAAVCRGIPGRWRAGDGFREWPVGVERAEDADSGPVVSGIGAAASAFGISAARAMGTSAWHSDWNRSPTASLGLAAKCRHPLSGPHPRRWQRQSGQRAPTASPRPLIPSSWRTGGLARAGCALWQCRPLSSTGAQTIHTPAHHRNEHAPVRSQ